MDRSTRPKGSIRSLRRGWFPGLMALGLILGASSLGAQTTITPALEPRSSHPAADRAIAELKSPYCPGFMLEICPSPDAAAPGDSIQMLARDGMSTARLVGWMIGTHGEIYRAVPKAEGNGMWAWVGPPVGLALGVAGLFLLFMQIKSRQARVVPPPKRPVLSEAERARVQAAMREMEALEEPIL